MPETKKPIRDFILFVDTNSIYTDENNIKSVSLFPKSFSEKWGEIASAGDVKLLIPDAVFFELAYQKYRRIVQEFRQACSILSAVQGSLDIGLSVPPDDLPDKMRSKVIELLESARAATPSCERVPIPIDHLTKDRLREIAEASLWRYPPFEAGKTEKGFRDSLIVETLRSESAKHPHCDIGFLCKDNLLRQAVERAFQHATNFAVYDSLESFGNFINLARHKFTPEFLHQVSSRASAIFFGSESSLWSAAHIADRIRADYALHEGGTAFYNDPDEEGQGGFGLIGLARQLLWCTSQPQFFAGNSMLVSVVGENEFHWNAMVIASALYESRNTNGLLGIGYEAMVFGSNKKKQRLLFLNVEWKASVDADGNFSSAREIARHLVKERFVDADSEIAKKLNETLGWDQAFGTTVS